jgi:hypothetical protein
VWAAEDRPAFYRQALKNNDGLMPDVMCRIPRSQLMALTPDRDVPQTWEEVYDRINADRRAKGLPELTRRK